MGQRPARADPSGREITVDVLAETVRRLEARVEELEGRIARISVEPVDGRAESRREAGLAESVPAAPRQQPPSEVESVDGVALAPVLSFAGQACLVLCGAFLLRALTDTKVLPVQIGLLLGVVYALGWLVLTDFLGRRGQVLGASLFGVSSAVIAFPLVWEAVRKYGVVAGGGAAAAIVVVTGLALGVARRRDLGALAWTFTLGAIATCFALMIALHDPEPFAAVLILVGAATAWMYHERRWGGLRWPAAVAVDLFMLHTIVLAARPDGPPESYANLSAAAVLVLSLAFLLVYLATFAGQTLLRKRDVTVFEVVQTGAALLIGLGGAVRVCEATGMRMGLVAGGALVVALACYAVAFSQTELRWEHRKNFMFYAWLAFVLALAGCYLAVEGLPVLMACSALAIGGAVLGDRFRRVTLHYHSAGYLIAAAYSSGLAVSGLEFFVLPASEPWPRLTPPLFLALAIAVGTYVVVALASVDPRRPRSSRIPRLIIAVIAVLGCGGTLVLFVVNAVGNAPPKADPALVAAVRTVILAAGTIALAVTCRMTTLLELRWVVYLLLLGGGLKLVFEDLRHGTPIALFVAFGAYGLSLIASPRLVRAETGRGEPSTETEKPPARAPAPARPTELSRD